MDFCVWNSKPSLFCDVGFGEFRARPRASRKSGVVDEDGDVEGPKIRRSLSSLDDGVRGEGGIVTSSSSGRQRRKGGLLGLQ